MPFRASYAVYPAPWNHDTEILHIGIKGFDLPKAARPPANLVFLIDSSGSMDEPNKLPLLKSAFHLLVDQLGEKDRVSIVTYAGAVGVVLEPTPGSDHARILAALDKLEAGGSTAGGEGIRVAYKLAEDTMIKGGVNRVLLATDGDFNVGITDPKALEGFVIGERDKGVELTCLGFGDDNYNDDMMQKLAQAGNGNAAFIDTMNEANKVFVQQVAGTLFTIAKDVKIQIEFNPSRVAEYRLIGYETRMLNRTDFNNDKVDAGDIGSGHTVTALYEITPVGSKAVMADPLRYSDPKADPNAEIAFLKIRYKLPGETKSHLLMRPNHRCRRRVRLHASAARYALCRRGRGSAQLMRHDPYLKDFDYARAIEIAQSARGDDRFGYRREFIALLEAAKKAQGIKAARSFAFGRLTPRPAMSPQGMTHFPRRHRHRLGRVQAKKSRAPRIQARLRSVLMAELEVAMTETIDRNLRAAWHGFVDATAAHRPASGPVAPHIPPVSWPANAGHPVGFYAIGKGSRGDFAVDIGARVTWVARIRGP